MKLEKLIGLTLRLSNKLLRILNSDLRIIRPSKKKQIKIPYDIESDFIEIYHKCKNFTLTSPERMYSLYKTTIYISKHKIPGDIVECGVWKGGSMMVCALTLMKLKDINRKIYLYDTYEGMTEPTHHDIRAYDRFRAKIKYDYLKQRNIKWDYAPLNEVKKNLYSTGYPKDNLIFIKGKVEDTVPKVLPNKISILRLDTDWFESTYHELKFFFPKLSINGPIIIDDYGHWKGAKEATDIYFAKNNIKILLNRIDAPGRIGIKQNE